jgi:predicted transcriptional regulator
MSKKEIRDWILPIFFSTKGGKSRIIILELLLERPYNINAISIKTGLSYKNVQYHIEILEKHGFLSRTDGDFIKLFLISDKLIENISSFREIIQNPYWRLN